jgi:hypothetical protein
MLKRLLIEHLSAKFVLSIKFSKGKVTANTRFIAEMWREKALKRQRVKSLLLYPKTSICIRMEVMGLWVFLDSVKLLILRVNFTLKSTLVDV